MWKAGVRKVLLPNSPPEPPRLWVRLVRADITCPPPPPMPPVAGGGVKLLCPQELVPAAARAALLILMEKLVLLLFVALPVVAPPKLPLPVASGDHVSSQLLLLLFKYASTLLYQLPKLWPLACHVTGSKPDQSALAGVHERFVWLLFQPSPLARWLIQLVMPFIQAV